MDEYTGFLLVEMTHSTKAFIVIPILEKFHSVFGIPQALKSDNGPSFLSHEFKLFAKCSGFKHRKITFYWPKANAKCERFMKTLNKNTRISNAQRSSWKLN